VIRRAPAAEFHDHETFLHRIDGQNHFGIELAQAEAAAAHRSIGDGHTVGKIALIT
jgi:hypothetical protein